MSYFQSTTLSGGAVTITSQKAATEFFIGGTVDKTTKTYTSAASAKGIKTGNENAYRLLYDVAIRCVKPIVIPKATEIEFKIYGSDDDTTFKVISSFKTTLEAFNSANVTPLSFPIPSCSAKYLCMGITISGNSSSASDIATDGIIVASINPSKF